MKEEVEIYIVVAEYNDYAYGVSTFVDAFADYQDAQEKMSSLFEEWKNDNDYDSIYGKELNLVSEFQEREDYCRGYIQDKTDVYIHIVKRSIK